LNIKTGIVFVAVVSPLTKDEKGKSIYELTIIPPSEFMHGIKEYTDNPNL